MYTYTYIINTYKYKI